MSLKNLMILVLLSVSLVIGVVLTGGCVDTEIKTPEEETQPQIIEDITSQEAVVLIQDNQNNPDFIIIDVRTLEEFSGGHIENAINLDYYSETFRDELNKLDKDKPYLIYCRSGGRSANALNIMEELNFREVYNILGGINQLKAEGLPTTK
jgi:rhodanese-related sulfurtransferase